MGQILGGFDPFGYVEFLFETLQVTLGGGSGGGGGGGVIVGMTEGIGRFGVLNDERAECA